MWRIEAFWPGYRSMFSNKQISPARVEVLGWWPDQRTADLLAGHYRREMPGASVRVLAEPRRVCVVEDGDGTLHFARLLGRREGRGGTTLYTVRED